MGLSDAVFGSFDSLAVFAYNVGCTIPTVTYA